MGKVDVNLTIEERHREWAEKNHINLSSLTREAIEERMD